MENEKFYEDLCNIARVLPNLTASDIFTELNNLKDNQDRVQVILGKYFSSYEPEEHNCMSDDIKKIKRVVPSYPFIHINNDLVAVENKENRVQMVLKKYFDDKVKTAKRSLLENTDLSQEESSRKKFKSNDDITDSLPEINSVQASTSAEKDQSSSGTESYIVEEFTSEKSNKVESEICNKTTEMVSTENSSDANVQNKINDHCENTNDKCKKTDNCNKDSNETEKPTLLSILSSMFPQHSTKVISTICQELGVNICDKPKDRIVNHVVNALFNYATNEETVERDKTDVYNNESSVTSCNSVQSSENCSTQEYTIDDLQITNTGCAKPIPEDSTQEYGPTDDLEYYFRETVEYLISSITDKVTGDNTVQTSSIKEESLKTDNLLPQNEDLVSDVNLDFSSSTISAISDILEFSPVEDSKYAIPQLFPTLELNEPMETTNTTPFYNNPVPSTSTNSNLNSELNTNINNLSVPVSNASTNILELSKNDLILFSPPNYVTDFTNSGTKFRSDINVANHVLKTNSSASSLEYNRISDVLNFENALLNNRSPNLNSPLSTSTTRTTRFNTKSIAQSTPLVKPAAFQHKPSTVTTTKTSFTSHPSRTKVPWYTGSPRICNPIIKPATFQLRNQLTRINHGLVPSSNMYPIAGLNAVHTKVTQSFPSTSGIRNGGNNSTHATGKQDINKNTIRVRTDLYDTYFNGPELQSPPMRPEENDDIIFVSHGTLSPKRIVSEDRAIKPVTTSPSIIELISQNCIQSVDNNYFVPTTTNVIKMEEKPIVDVDQPCTSNANENHPYYFKLLEIFPDISPDYLRKLCFKASEKQTLDDLISVLLNGDYNKRNRPASPESHLDFEQQHTILQDLFPDADPTYLQHHCERLIDQPENFKQFVASLLENKNYPTKEEYLKKMKLSAQEKQYTTEFDVKKFLEVIPNPEKFFNDPQRRISYDSFDDTNYAVTFLKNTFCTTAIKDITSVFRKSNFNVLCSAKRLAKLRNMKTKRKPYPVTSCKNIPLLQEIAYVKHKNEIIEYIKKKELENKLAREEAKTAGLMKTCRCCYDDEVMPDDTETCASGEHIFCKDCIRRGCEVVIGDGKLDFPCLETCESFFTLQVLQAVLTPKVFSKMAQRKQMEEVKSAGIEELEFCPFCDFATIPAPGDKVFRCLNDDCMKESCRLCKEPSHIPLRCEEVEKDKDVKMRTYIENKMTEALLRKCYKCGLKFIKESGCNKMTCSCGAMMCYVCNQPVQDYKHFNGQGGDKLHLCPLYSDTHKLHVDAIKRGAESAKKELGVNNDNQLKIDPTADLDHHYKILSAQNPTIPNIPVIFPQDIIRLPHFHQ